MGMRQEYAKYNAQDLEVWNLLFQRQKDNLQDKACGEYLECLDLFSSCLNPNEVPDFSKINRLFKSHTGWEIHVVPGLIPVKDFLMLLADKKFCSSTWLRSKDKLDYLEEPDMFHDIFGHIPLLLNPVFSQYVHDFGRVGSQYIDDEAFVIQMQRLYWYTIEFGLLQQGEDLKIFGAGIISSYGETNGIFDAPINTLEYQIEKVMQTDFYTDAIQDKYFVAQSLEELFKSIEALQAMKAGQ